jgi:hypothetical protein
MCVIVGVNVGGIGVGFGFWLGVGDLIPTGVEDGVIVSGSGVNVRVQKVVGDIWGVFRIGMDSVQEASVSIAKIEMINNVS